MTRQRLRPWQVGPDPYGFCPAVRVFFGSLPRIVKRFSSGFAVLFASSGWAACEWWDGNRENNSLSKMARQAQQASTGQTS